MQTEDSAGNARLKERVEELSKVLARILTERHHWCHQDQRTAERCPCGKTQRDKAIFEVLVRG